jgi:ribosome-associated protein
MTQETMRQVAQAVRAVESKKGEDLAILEMDQNSGAFTDYFVICTGTNPRQIQAISDDVQKSLGEQGVRPTNVEGYNQAEWVLLDYVDFVVHVFSERARHFYDLERLWKSAHRRSLADLEKKPAAKAKKAVASRMTKAASTRSAKSKSKAGPRKAASKPRTSAKKKAGGKKKRKSS